MDNHAWHKRASAELREAMVGGIKTADAVRKLINAMHLNFRDDTQSDKEMLNNAALFTGMASACLLDYAEILADREADKLEEESK